MGTLSFSRALGTLGTADSGETFDDTYKNYRVVRGLITFSNSYATGGDTIPMTTVGLKEIKRMFVDTGRGLNSGGLSVAIGGTPQAQKVLAFDANSTEVANATDLSTRVPVPVWFLGF